MSKNQIKQQQQQKKQKAKKGGGGGIAKRGGRGPSIDRVIVDLLNPWTPDARVKVPDEVSINSICYRRRQWLTLAQDATTHNGAFRILPRPYNPFYLAPTWTGSGAFPITAWGSGTAFADQPTFDADFDRVRMVNFGIRITSVGPPLSSQGYITIVTATNDAAAGVTQPSDVALHKDEYAVKPGLDIVWLSKPLDNRAREYHALTTVATDEAYNWTYPYVFLEGSSADTALRIEVLVNYECLPMEGSVASRFTTQAAADNPQQMTSLRNMQRDMAPCVEVTGDVRSGNYIAGMFTTALVGNAAAMLGTHMAMGVRGHAGYRPYQG